jgi:hypothetical protein
MKFAEITSLPVPTCPPVCDAVPPLDEMKKPYPKRHVRFMHEDSLMRRYFTLPYLERCSQPGACTRIGLHDTHDPEPGDCT